jgi:hypothetical protein
MTSIPDNEIDEIVRRILLKLENAKYKDLLDDRYSETILRLSDVNYANTILQQIDTISARSSPQVTCDIEKGAVVKALLQTTWLERLYFIIRSFLMGRLSGFILVGVVWYLGVIDVYGMLIVDAFLFVFTLVITRLFDVQIVKATKKIVARLAKHRTTRDFIMNHF